MIELVENIKRPLKKGELFIVPCIISERDDMLYITPIINHPHNDKENGQEEVHYHADYRFIKHINGVSIRKHSKHIFGKYSRPQEGKHGEIHRYVLPVINEEWTKITPIEFIDKSKLSHNCIYKNKCPHRGFPMDQVEAVNGVFTCPLHGLKFDELTGTILNNI